MKNIDKSLLVRILFAIAACYIILKVDNFDLHLLISFIPFLYPSITSFKEYVRSAENENYIMLSKSNFSFLTLGISIFIVLICLRNLNIYTGILLLLAPIQLFIEYIISKRRVFFIDKNEIREIGKKTRKEITEITSLDIYPNNVEFRFNEYEILQVNKNELVRPKWGNFVQIATKIKTDIDNSNSNVRL